MVRGYEKRVICLKNPESALFEEAIFLLKDTPAPGVVESDIVVEANRILSEGEKTSHRTEAPINRMRRGNAICFLLGFAACALLAVPVCILL